MQPVNLADSGCFMAVIPNQRLGTVPKRGLFFVVDPNGNELFGHQDRLFAIRWVIQGFGLESVAQPDLQLYNNFIKDELLGPSIGQPAQ